MSTKYIAVKPGLGGDVTSVFPPIEFPCIVRGQRLTAKLTHIEDHPINFVYHLSFSNGYKTSFYSIEDELGFFEEGRGYSDYAKGVAGDLSCICGFRLDLELYSITMDESGENTNVWVKQDSEEKNKYSVYTPGDESDFRFYLIKTEGKGWIAGHPHPKAILTAADDLLAAKVCKIIDGHKAPN